MILSTWHLGGEEPDEVTLRAGHVPKLRYNREKGYLKGLNGAGGSSDREEYQLPDAFYWIKKYFPNRSYKILKSGKIWVITVHEPTLNVFSRKWRFLEFQNLSSPTFFEINA